MEVLEPPPRDRVPPEERWNAESVFATQEDWETSFAEIEGDLEAAERFRGRLAEGPALLADWFAFAEDLGSRFAALRVYAGMDYNTDATDAAAAARYDRTRGLAAALAQAFAFERPELLALGTATLRDWVAGEPRLAHYGHLVHRLEISAEHTRSAEIEGLLGGLAEPFASATQVHGLLANGELDFGAGVDASGREHAITQSTIRKLLGSPDRELRRSAYTRYADAHLALRNTMAALLATGVRQNVFLARARTYPTPLHAALEPDAIPLEVFHNLLATFRSNLPTWHRYWRAKRRLLGLDSFAPYDVHAPLNESPPALGYEPSVAWLCEAMRPLGDEYVETMRRGALADRWVDRSPNRGKRMGAFSSGSQGTYPFIMMSWTDDVFGMSTLAHELGHSMHSYLAWSHQPAVYSNYGLFAAEVASNFNQALLREHLFRRFDGDRIMELALVEEAMANFYRYFFVMPTLARFELEIHDRVQGGRALGAADMIDLLSGLFAEGYGDEVEFDSERVGITWAQFHTHLYSRFYAYQYATGIAGAHALARGIVDGVDGSAERYLEFLRAGGSRFPLDALKAAGVDLSTPAPVEAAFAVLAGLVDRLEALGG